MAGGIRYLWAAAICAFVLLIGCRPDPRTQPNPNWTPPADSPSDPQPELSWADVQTWIAESEPDWTLGSITSGKTSVGGGHRRNSVGFTIDGRTKVIIYFCVDKSEHQGVAEGYMQTGIGGMLIVVYPLYYGEAHIAEAKQDPEAFEALHKVDLESLEPLFTLSEEARIAEQDKTAKAIFNRLDEMKNDSPFKEVEAKMN